MRSGSLLPAPWQVAPLTRSANRLVALSQGFTSNGLGASPVSGLTFPGYGELWGTKRGLHGGELVANRVVQRHAPRRW